MDSCNQQRFRCSRDRQVPQCLLDSYRAGLQEVEEAVEAAW